MIHNWMGLAMFQTPVVAPSSGGSGTVNSLGKPVTSVASATPVSFPCIGSYSPNTRHQLQSTGALSSSISSQTKSLGALTSPLLQPGLPATAATTPNALIGCHLQPNLAHFSSTGCCSNLQRRKSSSPTPQATVSGLVYPSASLHHATGLQEPTPLNNDPLASSIATSAAVTPLPLARSPGIVQVS